MTTASAAWLGLSCGLLKGTDDTSTLGVKEKAFCLKHNDNLYIFLPRVVGFEFCLFAWNFIFICSFFYCALGLAVPLQKVQEQLFLTPNKGLYLL